MDRERNDTGLSACVNGGRFAGVLADHGLAPLTRAPLAELQVNVGRLCNQACSHCHVEAGPNRTEIMSWETMARIASWAGRHGIAGVDITGGAPELNPNFRHFVDALLAQGASITARCNLTVLLEAGQDDLAQWYAQRNVRLVCSLPCYSRDNVEQQRGRGVFDKSIEALQRLNRCGAHARSRLQPQRRVPAPAAEGARGAVPGAARRALRHSLHPAAGADESAHQSVRSLSRALRAGGLLQRAAA